MMSETYPEQLSYLQKPDEKDVPPELQEVFDSYTDAQMKNWGFINKPLQGSSPQRPTVQGISGLQGVSHSMRSTAT
jgi:hypothetical protein